MSGCYQSSGGVAKVYIANKSNLLASSIVPALESDATPADEGLITGITMESGTYFYDYTPIKFTANYVQTGQENDYGATGYEQLITLPFQKNEASTRNAIKLMKQSDLLVIVKDVNGKYFLLGEEFGLRLVANYESGTALSDHNRWMLTLKGMERVEAREVDGDIVDGLIYVPA